MEFRLRDFLNHCGRSILNRRPMRANALEAARRLACRFRFCNFKELTKVLL